MVLNFQGRTILPGFMNVHAHYTHIVSNLLSWGREGVTTIRNLVSSWDEYRYCKTYIRQQNDPRIPRVLFTGPCLDVPGGRAYPYRTNGIWLTSVEDARLQTNFLLDQGVDLVKVYLEDGSYWGESFAVMPPEMLRAIVETAHARRARVTAHVQMLWILEMALDCGVDDIAHSILDQEIPDAVIARMVQSDTYLVPTLEIYGPGSARAMGQANLKRLVDGGVHVALGTDFETGLQTGMPSFEMQLMQDAGITPMQIIVAATKHAAHVCGLGSEAGDNRTREGRRHRGRRRRSAGQPECPQVQSDSRHPQRPDRFQPADLLTKADQNHLTNFVIWSMLNLLSKQGID